MSSASALLHLTSQEREHGVLLPAHLQRAHLLLTCNGFVILRGAVPVPLVDAMKRAFDATVGECQVDAMGRSTAELPWRTATNTTFWIIEARLRAFVRIEGPFADPRVVANPFALAIMRQVLGASLFCNSVSSDTCLQGSRFQSPHRDIGFHADGRTPGIIANIPLMHCGLHNGPLEVWPGGSHLWRQELFSRYGVRPFDQDRRNQPMEDFAAQVPSLKLDLHPGDLLLRDPGMLHRGTPNETPEPRSMLTLGYFKSGYRYQFGHPEYNLTQAAFDALDPGVRSLMAPRFLGPDRYDVLHR